MTAACCPNHPEIPTTHHCEGCNKDVCPKCVKVGHVLDICTLCGEQAVPFKGKELSNLSPREQRRRERLTRPYSFAEALVYPFRGLGLYLFVIAVLLLSFCDLVRAVTIIFGLGYLKAIVMLLLIAMQFRIIRTTADGDNDLPDWPDYTEFGERFFDALTYVFILLLWFLPSVIYVYAFGVDNILTTDPNVFFWIGFGICLWIGSALTVMAWGAAGNYARIEAVHVHLHVVAFLRAGADAVMTTNLVFLLGALFLVARSMLRGTIPLVGIVMANTLLVYWLLTGSHLIGLMFRRRTEEMDAIYFENPAGASS